MSEKYAHVRFAHLLHAMATQPEPSGKPEAGSRTSGRARAAGYGDTRTREQHWTYERDCGPHLDDVDVGACPYCDGTGGEIIVTEPIDESDLELYAPPTTEQHR